MGRKRMPGLFLRGEIWHVDKIVDGRRIRQSCGTTDLEEASRFVARVMETERQARVYGVRPSRTFEQAAARFILENQHKRSLRDDVSRLKLLMEWIGPRKLEELHGGALRPFVEARRAEGVAMGTINHALKVVRRILNLAATEWVDEHGLTWLAAAPKIKLLPDTDRRLPYPLDWEEQRRLFQRLPEHLAQMALFAVNTGCRDGEVCRLQWAWELPLQALRTSVFIIPGRHVKNGEDRLVVLNRVAMSVVDAMRGKHATHVFTFRGKDAEQRVVTGPPGGRSEPSPSP